MRKLSILLVVVLVTSLVVGMTGAVYAEGSGTKDATANASFGVGGSISLNITGGSTVWFGESLEPGSEYKEDDATTLEVDSNIDIDWVIDISKSVEARPDANNSILPFNDEVVKNELSVSLNENSGTGSKSDIKASYTLENLKYGTNDKLSFPEGFYKIAVTYTVAAS